MKVKTVDFSSITASAEFTRSLKETGFAVIKNHPISHKLMSDTFQDWAKFFSSDEKFKYTFDPAKQSGYFPFKTENAKNASKKDLKEFYHYYTWGVLPAQVEQNTKKLYNELITMGGTLLDWIESNTPSDVRKLFSMPLSQMIVDSYETLLRPIHYPPLQGTEEEGAVRAAEHEDINLITLLPASTAPGLQVKDLNGNWHPVECDPGTIAINSGDMLQMASGGYYVSTPHRVMNPTGEAAKLPRYSMPLFIHPGKQVRLSATDTAGSYLDRRLREIGLKK